MEAQSNGSLDSYFEEAFLEKAFIRRDEGEKAAAVDTAYEHPRTTYSRFFKTVIVGVSGSVVSAAIGSELLNASLGNAYRTRSMVAASALGGMALFTACGAALVCLEAVSNPNINAWTVLALGTGLAALSGVLGAVMLDADDLGVEHYLAAPALGAVVLGGVSAMGLGAHACSPSQRPR